MCCLCGTDSSGDLLALVVLWLTLPPLPPLSLPRLQRRAPPPTRTHPNLPSSQRHPKLRRRKLPTRTLASSYTTEVSWDPHLSASVVVAAEDAGCGSTAGLCCCSDVACKEQRVKPQFDAEKWTPCCVSFCVRNVCVCVCVFAHVHV